MASVRIQVKVYPSSPRSEVVDYKDGIWRMRIKAPPEKGKANKELIDFLSEALDISKNRIEVVAGQTGRNKILSIEGLEESEITGKLDLLSQNKRGG